MSNETKATNRRGFINYAITAALTGVAVGIGTYFAAPPREVVKTATTTVPAATVTERVTVTATVTPAPPITPKEKVNLKAWYITDPVRTEYYQTMAKRFSSQDPEVNFEFEFQTAEKIRTAFATGTEPDIVYIVFGEEETNFYASKGALVPIDVRKHGIPEKLIPDVLDLTTLDGKVYMIPTNLGAGFLFYNEDMVKGVGYDWKDLQQMPIGDFSSMCEKLKAKGNTPFIHSHAARDLTLCMLTLLLGNNIGRDRYLKLFQSWKKDAKEIEVWNQPEVVKVFDTIGDWLKREYFVPGINAIDFPSVDRAFIAQKAAMTWHYISRVVIYKKDKAVKFQTAPGPIMNKAEPSKIQIHGTGYAISKRSKNPDGAMRFISFLVDEEAGIGATKVGILTPAKKAFSPENYKDFMPWYQTPFDKYNQGAKGTIPRGDAYMSPEINSAVFKAFAKFLDRPSSGALANELDSIFEKSRKG